MTTHIRTFGLCTLSQIAASLTMQHSTENPMKECEDHGDPACIMFENGYDEQDVHGMEYFVNYREAMTKGATDCLSGIEM